MTDEAMPIPEAFPPASAPAAVSGRPMVIGVGRAGVRAVGMLSTLVSGDWLELHAWETDQAVLAECPLDDDHKMLIDKEWRNGIGTGGNLTNATRSMSRERPRMEAVVGRASWVIVLCGLGGGTGTAGAQALEGVTRRLRVPSVFITGFPFSLEGHGKRRIADDAVKDLLPVVDVLVCLPNDLLFSVLPSDTTVAQAFEMADRELAKVTLGLAGILRETSLLSADMAMLREVFHERKSFCGIGVGASLRSESLNPGHLALERLIDSPFLGGAKTLKEADAVILSLTGGEGLSIGEVTATFEAAQHFLNPESRLIVAASVEPEYGEQLQLTALAVKYDGREATDRALADYREHMSQEVARTGKSRSGRGRTGKPQEVRQLELPLETVSRGVFINTAMSIYNGEDLDIPTWQRREVHIDLGE